MKIKRILAAALAGVMAITSSVVTSVTSSAADSIVISGTDIAYSDLITYDTITVNYSPKAADACSHGASHGGANPAYCNWCGVAVIATVNSNGADTSSTGKTFDGNFCWWWEPSNYFKAASYQDSATCTATVSVADILTSFTADPAWKTEFTIEKITLSAQDCTFNSATATPADTTVYVKQDITSSFDAENNIFNGTFNKSNAVGANARIEFTFTTSGAYGGFQILDKADTDAENWNNVLATLQGDQATGTYTKSLKFSDVAVPESLKLNVWDVASIDSVVIYNADTASNVFTVAVVAPTAYNITTDVGENGAILVPVEAEEGEEVEVTVTPVNGYMLDSISARGESGAVTVFGKSGTFESVSTHTFTMPAEAVTVKVTFKAIEVEAVAVRPDSATIVVGETATLTAEVTPDNALDTSVTWSSSDTSVATVDQNGKVTAVAEGEATITAEAANGVKATALITTTTKKVPATAISLSKTELELEEGSLETITYEITPDDSTDEVVWTTSDSAVATVVDGSIKAIKAGTATITATAGTVSASCTVTVTAPVVEEPEEEVLQEGTYSDGKWEQLSADEIAALGELETNTVVGDGYLTTQNVLSVQYSAAEKKFRIYQVYSAEALADKTSASIVVKKGDVALKLTTDCVYTTIAEGQTAPEGCYYIAWVISEVEDPTAFSYSRITLA